MSFELKRKFFKNIHTAIDYISLLLLNDGVKIVQNVTPKGQKILNFFFLIGEKLLNIWSNCHF